MDSHQRFMATSTTELAYLFHTPTPKLKEFWENETSQLVQAFILDVTKGYSDVESFQHSTTLRSILCLFYENKIKLLGKKDTSVELLYQRYAETFKELCINSVQHAFHTLYSNNKISDKLSSETLDVLILYMALYYDVALILKDFKELQELIHSHLLEKADITLLHIELMVCYMDSLYLHQMNSGLKKLELEDMGELFLKNIKTWFTLKDRKKFKLLTLLLPKLIQVINQNEILTKVWEMIFSSGDNPEDTLSVLCLTADIWFPIESDYDKSLFEQTMEEPFWRLLLIGLSNPLPERQKQALYLIKRVVDFADKHKIRGSELGNYQEIRPLVCTGTDSEQEMFKKNLHNFFLILEALEEKQKHLVTPIFPLVKNLLNETLAPENGKTRLHVGWVRCALLRILEHDNKDIVKWGLPDVLTFDPELYNDDFLSAVLRVLNEPYLYENDENRDEPTVVRELTVFFNDAERKNSDLISKFLVKASKMTWKPVALFYVIHALSRVKRAESVWEEVELEAVRSLVEINLTTPCQMLCFGSQIELLEALTHFATESLDLVAVANTLSAFSTSGALIRGQLAWQRISAWMSKVVKQEEAFSFLEKICGQMTSQNDERDLSVKTFSIIIMFLNDAHLILSSKLCPGLTVLRNLLHCLIEAAARPYANAKLRKTSIELIYYLMEFTSSKDCILRELIYDYADATLRFIFKSLRNVSTDINIDDINTYGLVTKQFFTAEDLIDPRIEILNHVERFEIEAWNIIEDAEYTNNVQRLFGIKILYACLKGTSMKVRNYEFIGPLCNTYKTLMTSTVAPEEEAKEFSNENTNLQDKIRAEYCKFVAELFHVYVEDEPANKWIPDIEWIEEVSHLILVGRSEIFVALIGILSQIFYKEAVDVTRMDNFKSALKLCWKSSLECDEGLSALEEIMKLIFSSPFLERKETRELTIEFTNEMLDKADKIPGLSIILLKGLTQTKQKYLFDFHHAVLACLLHETVPSRSKKIEHQACSYVFDSYQEAYSTYLSNINVNNDATTRAYAFILLHEMIIDDPTHGGNLLPLIVAKLDQIQKKQAIDDSQIHCLENNIMQVLLVLQPILEKDDIEELHSVMCNTILSESSQPSVRIMQEWLLVRIYLENETLRTEIWNLFDQGEEKRVGSLCSVVSIVYHVARLLSSDFQQDFMNLAFHFIMPLCMAHQFNVRLCAQVVASKLFDLATEKSYSAVTEKYSGLYITLTKSLERANLMKNSIKQQDDFYFTIFNPIDDYSLETLFYELPRLLNVSLEECIPSEMFNKLGFQEYGNHPLKLSNLKSDMEKAQKSTHTFRSSESGGLIADEIDGSLDCSNGIQKKFIPWTRMTLNEDELSEASQRLVSRRKALTDGNNMILVASLIDKLPNLGGLSRTCEILGVQEFVMSFAKHSDEKDFQNLSGSAEKLISLVEVKPDQLQAYLLEKKNIGYRLVGVEQTVKGTNLMDMKFEKKTVLLLGNERAGIPPNLIPLLDECVEIPQVGVVRSLNVDATGAICLWEYFKQHRSS